MIRIKDCLILLFIIMPVSAFSQEIRFSAVFDPQVTWMRSENQMVENAGVRGGIDIGFEMDYFFSPHYAFSTGLSLNNTGGKLKFEEPAGIRFEEYTVDLEPGNIVIYRLQYLNIPLGMKFTTREIGYITAFIKLGTTAHINTRSFADISAHGIENEKLGSEINSFTYSYHFGAGVHYSLGGRTALIGGIEYKHRFVDIIDNADYMATLHSFALRLGILF
jgi:hypothetical protein